MGSKENIYHVRPPTLRFKKVDETSDYIEYSIKTLKNSKDTNHVKTNDPSYYFVKDIDSLIFCNSIETESLLP